MNGIGLDNFILLANVSVMDVALIAVWTSIFIAYVGAKLLRHPWKRRDIWHRVARSTVNQDSIARSSRRQAVPS